MNEKWLINPGHWQRRVATGKRTGGHWAAQNAVILGCPTRFGNVTAEMKAFLDTSFEMGESQQLAGKLFACFTSCLHSTNEGIHALDNMVYWAQSQGMIHIPFGIHVSPSNLENQPASGIVHLGGLDGVFRPSQQLGELMSCYADTLASYLQE